MKGILCVSMAALLVVALLGTGTVIAGPTENTAFGTGALPDGTGDFSSAFGFDALNSNTTGQDNTATGTGALEMNSTGNENTAIGAFTLANNSMGFSNTAIGTAALTANTTGSDNTGTGDGALDNSPPAKRIPLPEGARLR